ncbi:hypothetical protein M0411_09685 [Xanthomonas hortorum pv. vitians]|uniref:Response regulatory domain-containing protein n=1 Tax=Xanthomonas hortorum pv. vitians TaxID=83224 RepID=A0AAW8ZS64_9XANT|nr:response regulator [Xanthomonas hortorum]MCE4300938.1 hypothetical protein [Xanthomonas hortorum pv. vitians]MCE4306213.1 hypothetical protein [Xanthomonas hortorum pv. vitians]MCE4342322.1 hypothetical protein [Xanthomonas hortorum pv. vitians]MCE4505511.1 hypothetical protein [Xanthomonas hortorum pv. vitians]MCE4521306.1 hypothetical protein [Xanthomonas hortorum pv. vitians]
MHLLLVEDDTMLANAICAGVRQQSWTIDHVGSANAAKTVLVDHRYTAVLLDIGLPGESGLTVIRFMRGQYDATPGDRSDGARPAHRPHPRPGCRCRRLPGETLPVR